MGDAKLFTRDFSILMFLGFCFTATYLLIYISVSDFVHDIFNGDAVLGGAAAAIFVLGAFLSRILLARYVDIIGKRRCIVIAGLMSLVASLMYMVAPNYWVLLLVRVFHGFFYGFGMLVINSAVATHVPAARRSEGIGYYMLSFTIASSIGPYLSIQFMQGGGFWMIFTASAVLMLVSALSVAFLRLEKVEVSEEFRRNIHRFKISNFIERSALRISLVVFIFFFAYSSVLTFISRYGESIGLISATSYFFIFVAASTFVSRLFIGKLADVHGENIILIPCFTIFAVAMLLLSMADSALMLLLSASMLGFGVALVNSIGQTIAVRQSTPERYPICMSTFQIFMDFASGFGPLVLGAIIVLAGFRSMYLTAALLGLLALILYIVLHAWPMRRAEKAASDI
jgi:MFS family permease